MFAVAAVAPPFIREWLHLVVPSILGGGHIGRGQSLFFFFSRQPPPPTLRVWFHLEASPNRDLRVCKVLRDTYNYPLAYRTNPSQFPHFEALGLSVISRFCHFCFLGARPLRRCCFLTQLRWPPFCRQLSAHVFPQFLCFPFIWCSVLSLFEGPYLNLSIITMSSFWTV